MKKVFKILLIVIVFILAFFTIDIIQARVFDNSPLIKITKNMDGGNLDQLDVGVFTKTYYCLNGTQKTIFKWEEYTCPEENNPTITTQKITWDEITENGVDATNKYPFTKTIKLNGNTVSSVDTSTPGTYTIVYTIQVNGETKSITRTVTVNVATTPTPPEDNDDTGQNTGDSI